jgi:hypothetical protein
MTGGRAGFVFDQSGSSFKFVAVLADKKQVVIGHYSTSAGFVIDAYQSATIGSSVALDVTLNGDLVCVQLNRCQVLQYAYGTVVTRGQFGLLSWTGTNVFNCLEVRTNDPTFCRLPFHMDAAAAPTGPASGETSLTMDEVNSVLGAAIDRVAALLSLDSAAIAKMWATQFVIGTIDDNGLGRELDGVITLSSDAAGWGWYIDPSAYDDSEFPVLGSDGMSALAGSAASQGMDLLTVEMHELMHLFGYGDTDNGGLMSWYLEAGTRLAPAIGGSAIGVPADGGVAGLAAQAGAAEFAIPTLTPALGQEPQQDGPSVGSLMASLPLDVGAPIVPVVFGNGAPVVMTPPAFVPSVAPSALFPTLAAAMPMPIGGDVLKGWFASSESGSSTPAPAGTDSAVPQHQGSSRSATASQPAPTIAWNSNNGGSHRFDSGSDDDSQDWLDDFVNHLGQDAAQWNPNAALRVRPNSAPGVVPLG